MRAALETEKLLEYVYERQAALARPEKRTTQPLLMELAQITADLKQYSFEEIDE